MKNLLFFIEQYVHENKLNFAFQEFAKVKDIELGIGHMEYYDVEISWIFENAIEVGKEFVETLEIFQAKLEPSYDVLSKTLLKENTGNELEVKLVAPNVVYKGIIWIGHVERNDMTVLSLWIDTNKLELFD